MASPRRLPFPMPSWFTIKKGGPLADGIVITPSHNPPEDGGIKYNPPNGGPADTNVTKVVEDRANALMADGLKGVKRISLDEAMASGHVKEQDLVQPFVEGLADIVDMAAIQKAGLTLGVDPLGGSGIEYWKRIGEYYNLNLTIVNDQVDQPSALCTLIKTARSVWTAPPSVRWRACWHCVISSIWRLLTTRIMTVTVSSLRQV